MEVYLVEKLQIFCRGKYFTIIVFFLSFFFHYSSGLGGGRIPGGCHVKDVYIALLVCN